MDSRTDIAAIDKPAHHARARQIAREKLINATIYCLDHYGYAETSIKRIQDHAGVSRGALTHHFPSKEDLIVATIDHLLTATLRPALPSKRQKGNVSDDIYYIANNISGTAHGRALVETLLAIRTDKALNMRAKTHLQNWNEAIDTAILGYFESVDHDDADVVLLWTIARIFLRGLILHTPFMRADENTDAIITRFGTLLSPHLRPRPR